MSDDAPGERRSPDAPDERRGPDAPDEQPTVSIGSEGFQPDADDSTARRVDEPAGTTAGLENAVPEAGGTFGWCGWLLVAVIVVCLLVLPVLVTLQPVRILGFRTTYLLLPLVPAVLLGATAVWVAVRSRR